MTGALTDSPARITSLMLIDLGLGTTGGGGGSWPVTTSQTPDSPDEVIGVFDTTGRKDGRAMVDGMTFFKYGIMVRIRSGTHTSGFTKAHAVAIALDENVLRKQVNVGASIYIVQAVSRTGSVNVVGKEPIGGQGQLVSRRNLFTINAVVSLRQTV